MHNLTLMSKLVVNELHKSFFQRKTIAFVLLLLTFISLTAYLNYASDKGTNWKYDMKLRIDVIEKQIQEQTSKTEIDEFNKKLIDINEEELKLLKYRLNNDLPDEVITPYRFIYNCNTFSYMIFIFIAIFSANIISSEYSSGTIRQLLLKPVKRWKIFVAKYISSTLSGLLLTCILLMVSATIGFILFSKNSTSIYDAIILNGTIYKRDMLQYVFLTNISNIFSLIIISSLTFMISTIVRTSNLAITLAIAIYFGTYVGGAFLSDSRIYKYLLFSNMALDKYLPGNSIPFEGGSISFSLGICFIYFLLFFTIGITVFSKRDVY